MRKHSTFHTIILIFLCATLGAQGQTAYSIPQDDTVLRKRFADESVRKKEILVSALEKPYAKDYRAIYDDQFTAIAEFWKSTRPVTYAEAHDYLRSLVRKITDANPELKATDARVVFSRDWWPNAVSMGDGTIAINAGLLGYLGNEAELVFVICHELSHYYLSHTQNAIKKYVETINSDAYQSELKRLSKQTYGVRSEVEKLAMATAFNSRRHSRDNEAAADMQAFLFMKNTGYDCSAIVSTLELLDRVDDSLLHRPLDIEKAFDFSNYPFRKKWTQKESAIFSQMVDNGSLTKEEKDSLRTHPDCSRRIALVSAAVNAAPAGYRFIVNEGLFKKLKKDFEAGIAEECYRENALSRNLYYSLVLLQEGDRQDLAIFSIARCLNTLYEKQRDHKLGNAVEPEDKTYPRDYNLLLRMLGRLRLDEIASLCYHFCLQHEEQMKEDQAFRNEMAKAARYKEQ